MREPTALGSRSRLAAGREGVRLPVRDLEGGAGDSGHLTGHEDDVRRETSRERWRILAANFQDKTPLFDRLGLHRTFIHVGVSPTLPHRVV